MADINSTSAGSPQNQWSGTSAAGTPDGNDGSNHGIVSRVRERAAAELSTQKNIAFDGIGSVAQAVRQSTQHLREQQHDTLAGYVEQAADQIERFVQQLRGKDLNELFHDAQRMARRQPAIFIGSAFALGLVGARFLKSSPQDRRSQYPGDSYRPDRSDVTPRTNVASSTYSTRPDGQSMGSSTALPSRPEANWDDPTRRGTRTTTDSTSGSPAIDPSVSAPASGVSGGSESTNRSRRTESSTERSK